MQLFWDHALMITKQERYPGVVASAVIPCNGTMDIGGQDAVNPPII